MATNFGTNIAIKWLCVDDSDYAIGYEGGLSGRRQNADIADILHLKGRCRGNPFCLLMGYNFGCMIASDRLFDSRGGFSGSSYWMKTQPISRFLSDVAMATIFGFLYMGCTLAPPEEYD